MRFKVIVYYSSDNKKYYKFGKAFLKMCNDAHVYTANIKCCQAQILVRANLTPLTAYKWIITDARGNQYKKDFETDVDGSAMLVADGLPESLFSAVTPHIMVEVVKDDCSPVQVSLTGKFDRIKVQFTGVKEAIGC